MAEEMNLKRLSILCAFGIFALFAVLILSLLYFYRADTFAETFFSERTWFSIRLSLLTATIATLFSVALAIPSAYALSRFNFPGKKAVDTLLELPMIVSPAALGAMLLIFFNNPLGEWIQNHGVQFVFTRNGIILAQFISTVGVATRLVKAAMDEIPKRFEDVARTLGATPSVAFYTITLPLSRKGILASAILTWAKALGEFGATITIAGTMAMNTETLPIAIFMRLSTANIESTVVLILILTVIGLGTLYGVRLITRKGPYA
jgi:molybdate transport system permease protein